ARSPRRGMFVRRDRQEIQCQGCGYQPPGFDRARGRHAAARSHTAVTWARGDRGRIQAARRRAGLRRSRNNSSRAASLRCALSLLRRRPQQAAAGLTRFESHQPQGEKLAKPTCSTTANRTSQPVDCRSRSGDVRCSATNIGPCNDACCSWAPPPSARASPLAAAKLCLSWSRIPSNVEALACVRASRSARSRGSRFLPRISWKAGPCISSTFRATSSTPGTCHIRPACPATSPSAGPYFSTGALTSEQSFLSRFPFKGGVVLEADWNGKVLWEVRHPDHHHHGILLRNGNVLLHCMGEVPEEIARRVKG